MATCVGKSAWGWVLPWLSDPRLWRLIYEALLNPKEAQSSASSNRLQFLPGDSFVRGYLLVVSFYLLCILFSNLFFYFMPNEKDYEVIG